ncbi:hypothetical protein [Nocardioides sp.]|uniref:hypothetical protein n=1 Tax=Nocardioides sp. TaxID=35761 RepID=UPI0027215817|nr:hypothetical protein [Nocardioides sp.]MDO9457954.1 hypothetical protein [Nocardioides sp.]
MSLLPLTRSLAHPSTDPPTLVARAQAALGWSGSDFLVGLQGYDELMATLDVAHDVEGLVRIGDPTSPPLRLLSALNGLDPEIRLARVATVPSPWRWTRLGGGAGDAQAVALRQQAYSDVVGAMGRAGVAFRVVPDDTTTEDLLAAGQEAGSAVVDVDELRGDDVLIVGFLEQQPALSYGLLARGAAGAPVDAAWVSMTPQRESAGTLMVALQRFADLGIDLDFLHSDPHGPGLHDFHVGFRSDAGRVDDLQVALTEVGFSSRVLAAFALDR